MKILGKYGQCNASDWRDIIAIAANWGHTVGLKKDGTVIAVGDNQSCKTDLGEYRTFTRSTWFGLFPETKTVKQEPRKLF